MNTETEIKTSNFIRNIVLEDLASNKHGGKTTTRFPPEPNGYLHIGHAKAICLNFGIAQEFPNAKCHLRFDDTNPTKEEVEYVESIKEDVRWLGFDWGENLFFASDYFDQLHEYAIQLIKLGKAYVCSLTTEQIREYRGTLTEPGKNSPYRDTSIEENLDLFERMKNGEFAEGEKVLRAKIDMASPNMNMRDPVVYRIIKASHHRTGDKWMIYPMYDYTHCLSDMIEGITHSLCTLEFEDHRPLYDWYLDTLKTPCHPRQIEFARLNINHTVLSKRKLLNLVNEKIVDGWDDPRLPTLSGIRRLGFPPAAIRNFCERIGITKKESCIDISYLENCVREDLDANAPRAMAVLDPIKVVITNYSEGETEKLIAHNHPKNPEFGDREITFGREIYIEQEDFMENPPKKFHRLSPGGMARLRYAYIIKCDEVIKDDNSKVIELRCTYFPESKGGVTPEGIKKVKGIIHWVEAGTAITSAEVRVYNHLFNVECPGSNKDTDWRDEINPNSLEVKTEAKLEASLANANPGQHFQFERQGYFFVDPVKSTDNKLVFNRTVTLRATKLFNVTK